MSSNFQIRRTCLNSKNVQITEVRRNKTKIVLVLLHEQASDRARERTFLLVLVSRHAYTYNLSQISRCLSNNKTKRRMRMQDIFGKKLANDVLVCQKWRVEGRILLIPYYMLRDLFLSFDSLAEKCLLCSLLRTRRESSAKQKTHVFSSSTGARHLDLLRQLYDYKCFTFIDAR